MIVDLAVSTNHGQEIKGGIIIRKVIITIFIILLVFINGCKSNNNSEMLTVEDEGEFLGMISNGPTDISDQSEASNKDIVIDEKLALEIGNSVLKSVYGEEIITNSNFIVYEIQDTNVIIVSRVPKDPGVLGGDYNVAINKTDGSILKIWAGE